MLGRVLGNKDGYRLGEEHAFKLAGKQLLFGMCPDRGDLFRSFLFSLCFSLPQIWTHFPNLRINFSSPLSALYCKYNYCTNCFPFTILGQNIEPRGQNRIIYTNSSDGRTKDFSSTQRKMPRLPSYAHIELSLHFPYHLFYLK